ncbi:MAG: hypothetical protein QOG54_502 [Actinomycetota bacterium]|jgi:predicted RNA-binding protein with PIN domain|nr:hypothetical protein [Actinomycetota bacterium]
MPDLPDEVAQTLLRAVGAYVRSTDAIELPARLKPIKKVAGTGKGLARHRAQLLAELDDEVTKARMLEWLDKGKPALSKEEARVLRSALVGEEGWVEAASSSPKKKEPTSDGADVARFERRIEREKEATRKAKDEARTAREDKAQAVDAEATKARSLAQELKDARSRVAELERSLGQARAEATAASKEAERQRRNVKRAEEKSEGEKERLKARLKVAEEAARELKSRPALSSTKPTAPQKQSKSRGPRKILKAPKGRLDDAPETLDAWLSRDDVHLLVDGYNVTRHEQGFAHLDLEKQRDLLVEKIKVLARKKNVAATIVFDGSEVPPGTRRRKHGSVTVEYSKPDRSGKGDDRNRADDHIVELIEKLPPSPIIVVTNDKELRDRVEELKATPARSQQLLALLR